MEEQLLKGKASCNPIELYICNVCKHVADRI